MIPIGGSTTVKHVGYNAESGTMHVQFKQGDVYEVSGVKPEEHAEFLASPSLGKYYSMNEVAGRIWTLVQRPIAVAALIDLLVGEFEVERTVCEQQVLAFLRELHADGLVHVSGV